MAKNPRVQSLFDDEDRIDIPDPDIKYKEIKDRNMLSRAKNCNLASPINCDLAHETRHASPGSVLHQQNDFDDTDNTIPCPTCRGTGTIHADDSSLVALIPVKDERLRPKRTKLKIIVAIFLTLLICGVTLFFLFPRTPTLKLVSVTQHNASFPVSGYAYIIIKNRYAVKNRNFVSVDLTSISLTVEYGSVQVAGPDPVYEFQTKTVDIRSSTNFDVYIKTMYSQDMSEEEDLKFLCKYNALLEFDISTELQADFLFHTEKLSSNDQAYIRCHYNATATT